MKAGFQSNKKTRVMKLNTGKITMSVLYILDKTGGADKEVTAIINTRGFQLAKEDLELSWNVNKNQVKNF